MQELIFRSKAKAEDLEDHWVSYLEGFSLSPQEFYRRVEQAVSACELPGLILTRVEFGEAGLLSDRRLYLRMLRDRLTFDVCAASFGGTFFFSCRSFVMSAVLRWWHIVVVFGVLFGLYAALQRALGMTYAAIAVLALLLAAIQVLRNTWSQGWTRLDAILLTTPVIAPIYEKWFRKETYYRRDTYIVYRSLITKLVKKLASEAAAEKGVKLVHQYERAPVLGGLYKPLHSIAKQAPG